MKEARTRELCKMYADVFQQELPIVVLWVTLCIAQLHPSFPTSIAGQPIFLSASEAIASGKWIWWILSGKQHLSDCQILGEETEMLWSWFTARDTCPWGPGDGGRRLAKCKTSETPLPEFISILAQCDFGFQGKEFTWIKMSEAEVALCPLLKPSAINPHLPTHFQTWSLWKVTIATKLIQKWLNLGRKGEGNPYGIFAWELTGHYWF